MLPLGLRTPDRRPNLLVTECRFSGLPRLVELGWKLRYGLVVAPLTT
jgi:hypothetical protein